jgi:type III pantothenate kinase
VLVERPGVVLEAADNTPDAVASGCWQAAAALVERFVSHMSESLGGAPQLILGGGDAQSLAPLIAHPSQLSQDSVLRGLSVWSDAHSPIEQAL